MIKLVLQAMWLRTVDLREPHGHEAHPLEQSSADVWREVHGHEADEEFSDAPQYDENEQQLVLLGNGREVVLAGDSPQFSVGAEEEKELLALFESLDTSGDGMVSRIEIIKAMRSDSEMLGPILGLPAQNVRQEDGSRVRY